MVVQRERRRPYSVHSSYSSNPLTSSIHLNNLPDEQHYESLELDVQLEKGQRRRVGANGLLSRD